MMVRESQGPDPCRGNLRCQDFHDPLGRRADAGGASVTGTGTGTISELGGCYNCCCCDPCRFVRPELITDEEDERLYCCRCVPRGFYLRFVPDDPNDECCRQVGLPIFNQPDDAGAFRTRYEGTLFGVTVLVEVGRVIGAGTGSELTCGWRITSTLAGSGSGTSGEQTFVIDHDTTTCLYVPIGVDLGTVEGPDGCPGKLILDDIDKARLPFLERDVTADWTDPSFIDISGDPCGDCVQVCSRVCVAGIRHTGGSREHVEFAWFDETPTGTSTVADRGWRFTNSDGDVETLFLT